MTILGAVNFAACVVGVGWAIWLLVYGSGILADGSTSVLWALKAALIAFGIQFVLLGGLQLTDSDFFGITEGHGRLVRESIRIATCLVAFNAMAALTYVVRSIVQEALATVNQPPSSMG